MENIPNINDIKAIKPEIDLLKFIDSGGFRGEIMKSLFYKVGRMEKNAGQKWRKWWK